MVRDPRAWLWDIQQACQNLAAFLHGVDLDAYLANALVRAGVERQFEIIGEALSQLSRSAPELAQQVPDFKQIVGFRNILIHGYATVDNERVWRIAQSRLPILSATMLVLLSEPRDPP